MWFNPDELLKIKIEPLATLATLRLFELKNSNTDSFFESRRVAEVAPSDAENSRTNALIVTCYTPVGNPVQVLARDEEHKAFLLKMNPEHKQLTREAINK